MMVSSNAAQSDVVPAMARSPRANRGLLSIQHFSRLSPTHSPDCPATTGATPRLLDIKLLGDLRADIQHPPIKSRPSIFHRDDGRSIVLKVGDPGCCAERQRLARSTAGIRVKAAPVGHFPALEAHRVERDAPDL